MIFSSEFWPISLLWALIAAVISGFVAFKGGNEDLSNRTYGRHNTPDAKPAKAYAIKGAVIGFVVVLFMIRFVLYYMQPVFQGTLFGYFPLIISTLIPALAVGLLVNGHNNEKIIWYSVISVLAVFLIAGGQKLYYGFGPANALRFASLPNIEIASEKEQIPPTDPDRMVLVSKDIAAFRGQSAISTETNIASRFGIDKDAYTLQSVSGHRYWIAPLEPINSGDTYWSPLLGDYAISPGYVVVDAENPEEKPLLKLGFKIRLFVGQNWVNNLSRYVYQRGYDEGDLDEPIFEVDDKWVPHYTIGYIRRPFGGVSGSVLEKVIAVDVADEEAKLHVFDLHKKPEWIDRVVSDDLVKEYAEDWGMYGGDFARENTWKVIFGINKTGTREPSDIDLAYTREDHNVWVVPMTSTSVDDHSVNGVLVFQSSENKGVFYPGLKGFNEASSVVETMQNARDNVKHYPVESVQLYSIYGELTWVAIYATPQEIGASFGGIGIMRAFTQNAADVIFANDKQTALRLYATQLAHTNNGGTSISQTMKQSKVITGKIKRIALLPSSLNGGSPTYLFVLAGDSRIYLVSRDSYPRIPLVEKGDAVVFTFLDTKSQETAVNTFSCKSLDDDGTAAPSKPLETKE
ncbi:MAG: YIP1 family protein [Leptolyngbya sp.]|nr:YIP1 family protein [Candidatus Melainabacteria bacterium]